MLNSNDVVKLTIDKIISWRIEREKDVLRYRKNREYLDFIIESVLNEQIFGLLLKDLMVYLKNECKYDDLLEENRRTIFSRACKECRSLSKKIRHALEDMGENLVQ